MSQEPLDRGWEWGADINAANDKDCANGKISKYLLDNGANIEARSLRGETPLEWSGQIPLYSHSASDIKSFQEGIENRRSRERQIYF